MRITLRPAIALPLTLLAACGVTERRVFEPVAVEDAARPVTGAGEAGSDAGGSDSGTGLAPDAGAAPFPEAEFTWVETLEGQGTCRAGRYVGSFACFVSGGVVPVELEGQISFTLRGSEEEQTLNVVEGTLSDLNGIFSATLTGKLLCLSDTFTGEASDGIAYALPPSITPGMSAPPLFAFAASFVGAFDDQALVIAGNWTMLNSVGGGCSGLWRAAAVP